MRAAYPMPGYPIGSRWLCSLKGFSDPEVRITDTLKTCAVVRYVSTGTIRCVPYESLRKPEE
jgi:hypothetical protein